MSGNIVDKKTIEDTKKLYEKFEVIIDEKANKEKLEALGYQEDIDVQIIAQIDFVHENVTKKDLDQFISHLRYILQQRYPGKNFMILPTSEPKDSHSAKCNCGECKH